MQAPGKCHSIMKKDKSPIKLAKFLAYVLGRRPDEFGLVPDEKGWVKIKDLVKAACEEEGWRYVRRSHINEVLLTLPDPPVEAADPLIRAADTSRLSPREPALEPPKLLYTCVRRRAWPHVSEKGIFPSGDNRIVLAADDEMARRIGRRSDADPVLITVNVDRSQENGVVFYTAGKGLFLAGFLPAGGFTGPPLPKEKPQDKKPATPKPEPELNTPGTFRLWEMPEPGRRDKSARKQRKKEIDWKKGRRQLRKNSRRK